MEPRQAASSGPTLSVVVPAYNEEGAIGPVLDRLVEILRSSRLRAFEIIVVDDGSTDATAERVRERADVTLIRGETNRGYGAALKVGLRRARHEWVAITDADGTYPNERIPELLAAADGAAMVVGARTADDAHYPVLRSIPKLFLRRYAEWVTRSRIADLNSGLRVFRRETVLRALNLLPDGFSFTTTLTMALLTNHEVVRFVPIGYSKRIGRSKIRPIRDTLNFMLLIVRTGTYFAPFRVFMPPAALLFVSFLGSLIYDTWVLANLTDKTLILLTVSLNLAVFALLADMIHKRGAGF